MRHFFDEDLEIDNAVLDEQSPSVAKQVASGRKVQLRSNSKGTPSVERLLHTDMLNPGDIPAFSGSASVLHSCASSFACVGVTVVFRCVVRVLCLRPHLSLSLSHLHFFSLRMFSFCSVFDSRISPHLFVIVCIMQHCVVLMSYGV